MRTTRHLASLRGDRAPAAAARTPARRGPRPRARPARPDSCPRLLPGASSSPVVEDRRGRHRREATRAAFRAHDDVLDPDPEVPRAPDGRLVREGHPGFERRPILDRDERLLVDVEPDAVAHAMREVLSKTGV